MDKSQFDGVKEALHAVGGATSGDTLVALGLAGTLTMAILQMLKDLTPVRESFQRQWMKWWLNRSEAGEKIPFFWSLRWLVRSVESLVSRTPMKQPEQTLVDLATGGDDKALYSLQAEQLVAQMAAASQIVLDYPRLYIRLLLTLALGADRGDIEKVVEAASPRELVSKGETLPPDYIDARNRVSHRIQRNLDGLQISMSYRWQLYLQFLSIVLSILVVEAAISILADGPKSDMTYLVGAGIGVIGGYLAPVTRDLLAALQNLRKP